MVHEGAHGDLKPRADVIRVAECSELWTNAYFGADSAEQDASIGSIRPHDHSAKAEHDIDDQEVDC